MCSPFIHAFNFSFFKVKRVIKFSINFRGIFHVTCQHKNEHFFTIQLINYFLDLHVRYYHDGVDDSYVKFSLTLFTALLTWHETMHSLIFRTRRIFLFLDGFKYPMNHTTNVLVRSHNCHIYD